MPYLSNCSEIWGKTYITYINSLYLLQKKVVRTMSKVGRLDHTNALFVDLRLLKLSDLIDLKIAIIMFRVKQKVLPPNIMNYYKMIKKGSYETRHTQDFKQVYPVYTRTTHKSMNISIYGVELWNQFEKKLKNVSKLIKFKCMFKNQVILKYKKPNVMLQGRGLGFQGIYFFICITVHWEKCLLFVIWEVVLVQTVLCWP